MSRPYTRLDGISCRGDIYAAHVESGTETETGTETGSDYPLVEGA